MKYFGLIFTIMLAALVSGAFLPESVANRAIAPNIVTKSWQDKQAEYRQTLIERAQRSNRDFAKMATMKSSGLDLSSVLLVSFPQRLGLSDIQSYLRATDGKLLELHRTVGDDHTSTGIDGLAADFAEAEAKLRGDFLAYLDMRENELVTMRATLDEKHLSARQRIEFNLKSVLSARANTIKDGIKLDGVVIQIKNRNLAKANTLPNGSSMLAVEFQEGSKRSFALPHDVINPNKN